MYTQCRDSRVLGGTRAEVNSFGSSASQEPKIRIKTQGGVTMLMPCARLGCYDAKGDAAVAHGFRGVDSWKRVPSRVPIGKSPSWSVEEMYLSRTLNDKQC